MTSRPKRRGTAKSRERGSRETQRERLANAMVAVCNREGYAGANVSAVIAAAGVSRPTFYDYFEDREGCFLAIVEDVREHLCARVRAALEDAPAELTMHVGLSSIFAFADAHPEQARFLMAETLAAGRRARDARDEAVAELARLIDRPATVVDGAASPDVASCVVLGGLFRLLASRLRHGEPAIVGLLVDVLGWLDAYLLPVGEHRWDALRFTGEPAPADVAIRLRAPLPLKPGRPLLSDAEVAQTHRQRIMFAAAHLAGEKGYAASTVADIAKLARVDRGVFYGLFDDKQDVFMAVHELGLQEVLARTAGAYFTGSRWPERIWRALRDLSGFLDANPTIARVGFVEAYAVGSGAAQRVEDARSAFAIFLQEGVSQSPYKEVASRLRQEAVITAVFELIYLEASAEGSLELSNAVPRLAFLCLAPFIGAREAHAYIEQQRAGR